VRAALPQLQVEDDDRARVAVAEPNG
jgi:hypothetical protein